MVEIELDPSEEPKADPWNSYYCARFAWADEGAELFRTQHQTRQPCTEKRFESSHYIDIATETPEFREWKWVEPEQLPNLIVPFKRDLYCEVLDAFADYL